jgi:hypothetical protein
LLLLLLALLDPEVDVVPIVVDAAVVVVVEVVVVVVFDASTGSWPLASVTVINSQTATNSAAAPPTTRLRSSRTRAARATLIFVARSSMMYRLPGSGSKRMRII